MFVVFAPYLEIYPADFFPQTRRIMRNTPESIGENRIPPSAPYFLVRGGVCDILGTKFKDYISKAFYAFPEADTA